MNVVDRVRGQNSRERFLKSPAWSVVVLGDVLREYFNTEDFGDISSSLNMLKNGLALRNSVLLALYLANKIHRKEIEKCIGDVCDNKGYLPTAAQAEVFNDRKLNPWYGYPDKSANTSGMSMFDVLVEGTKNNRTQVKRDYIPRITYPLIRSVDSEFLADVNGAQDYLGFDPGLVFPNGRSDNTANVNRFNFRLLLEEYEVLKDANDLQRKLL